MTEIERLRADLEVFERYSKYGNSAVTKDICDKIARLVAEAADPWKVACGWINPWRERGEFPAVVACYDHLTAENERLTKRVAELEKARTIPIAACDGEPSDPILDPARVLATAAGIMHNCGFSATADTLWRRHGKAKPNE